MNKAFTVTLLLGASMLLTACHITRAAPAATATSAEPPLVRVGGYAAQATDNAEVVQAAQFAVRQQAQVSGQPVELVAIQAAQVQVVAGMNYRLQLQVKVNGQLLTVTAVVYQDVQQAYSLSQWQAKP